MNSGLIFISAADPTDQVRLRLLISSLRRFGGELADAPFWVFAAQPGSFSLSEHCRILPLDVPASIAALPFAAKVAACARAEALASASTTSLVWIDPACLVVQPPVLFDLGTEADAAFRPVHIRNVGLPPTSPLDAFWQGIYTAVGLPDVSATVTSFVDGQVLRAYYNSHAFAVNPHLGLMSRWLALFQTISADSGFQASACADPQHQVFLFQALLSALLTAALPPQRLRILPASYNYPLHLQERIPPIRRLAALDESVCFTYEDQSIHPSALSTIAVRQPLRAWLEAHLVA